MPFDPLSISGCLLWLKGDAGVYHDAGVTPCSNGQQVQQWNDQSGGGSNATSGTANSGIYTTGLAPSGLPCIKIDALPDNSQGWGTIITPTRPYTIFLVIESLSADLTGNHRYLNGTANWLIGPRGGFYTYFNGGFVSTNAAAAAVVTSGFTRLCADDSGTASHFYVEGTDCTQTSALSGAPGGLQVAQNLSERMNAYLAEILVYSSVLSSTDRGNVTSYLSRWQAAGGGPARPFVVVPQLYPCFIED